MYIYVYVYIMFSLLSSRVCFVPSHSLQFSLSCIIVYYIHSICVCVYMCICVGLFNSFFIFIFYSVVPIIFAFRIRLF